MKTEDTVPDWEGLTAQNILKRLETELAAAGSGSKWLTAQERQHALHGEAQTLLLWASGWTRTQLMIALADQSTLSNGQGARLQAALLRRKAGWPLQYAVGEAAFYGRLFAVRPGCLIPRPETEVLADLAIGWILRQRPNAMIADLGTGSGVLAVTLHLECPQTTVYAIDVSSDALDIARENAALLGNSDPARDTQAAVRRDASPGSRTESGIHFVHADGLSWLGDLHVAGPRLNVLVSNPPYIPSGDVEDLDDEVRLYEPRLALDGGRDGLDLYRTLSQLGDEAFADDSAALFLEVGIDQAHEVLRMFVEQSTTRWPQWHFKIQSDLRGIQRVVWGERMS